MLVPGEPAPDLTVPILDGPRWALREDVPPRYAMIAFFRGGFCQFCRAFLESLEAHLPELERLDFDVLAASMDTETQARQMLTQVALRRLRIAYGMSQADARRWQLYLSERRSPDGAARLHVEPALHLFTPDRRIYAVLQQSISCGRPDLASLIKGLHVLRAHQYPMRGNL